MKDVQCYELFGGIALKNHAFSFFIIYRLFIYLSFYFICSILFFMFFVKCVCILKKYQVNVNIHIIAKQ